MEWSSDRNESVAWYGIAVAILTEDQEQQLALQKRLEATRVARIVFSHLGFPINAIDPIIRQIQERHVQVVVVDLHADGIHRALEAIELIQGTTSNTAVFAIGEINDRSNIIAAMRAGACEYVDRQSDDQDLVEAFTRFSAVRTKKQVRTLKARMFTVINAKGGSGATTVAVNTALALQQNHGQTVLVDFALIGHAALHLNLQPKYSVLDALQNLHRMDATLLDGLMTSDENGLDLLAGSLQPYEAAATTAELARLFHLLTDQYRYVVIDCSSRIDATTKLLADVSNKVLLVGQMDVPSLWSAGYIRTFLHESLGRNQLQIVLNRYKKIPGFTEGELENTTGCEVLWKLPNSYMSVALAIDSGKPVVGQNSSELSRSFRSFAKLLATEDGLDWTGGSMSRSPSPVWET